MGVPKLAFLASAQFAFEKGDSEPPHLLSACPGMHVQGKPVLQDRRTDTPCYIYLFQGDGCRLGAGIAGFARRFTREKRTWW